MLRLAEVAFTERRVFQQLAVFAEVTLWKSYRAVAFYDEEPIVFCFKLDLINGTARNDNVVTITELQLAILSPEDTVAFVNEQHFIAVGIFVESVSDQSFEWGCQNDVHIVVEKDGLPAFQEIGFRLDVKTFETPGLQNVVGGRFRRYIHGLPGMNDHRRGVNVIQQGVIGRKTFGTEQLLRVQTAIGFAKLNMPFAGDRSKRMIVRHCENLCLQKYEGSLPEL
jgi:hypothetical protein